jgi:hypothetical protein
MLLRDWRNEATDPVLPGMIAASAAVTVHCAGVAVMPASALLPE